MAILTQRSVDALQPRTTEYIVYDDDPHGFGVRVWPSGRKVYVLKYELRGSRKDRRYTLGDHAVLKTQAAREMAKQFLAHVRHGSDPAAEIRKARQGKTLADLLTKYLTDVLPHASLSARRNKAIHLHYWQQTLGEVQLDELTPPKIAEARKPLRQGRSDSTVNRYLSSLSAALQVAVQDWGWLPMNPLRQVNRLGEPRGRVRWLEPQDELQRLMRVCEVDSNPYIYLVLLLELQTGMRKMDLMRMQWSQISFEASEARLRVHRSKNKRWDTVAVSGEVLIRLRAHHTRRDQTSPWVFPNRAKTGAFDIRRAWERVRREAGISDFRFHDLRHTFTSYLAMSGASVRELAEALGDNTLEMALRYAHLSEAHTASVVSRMAQKFLEPGTAMSSCELNQGEPAPGGR